MTDEEFSRLARQWRFVAGEEIRIGRIKGAVVAFGSEVEMLRLAYNYRLAEGAALGPDGGSGWQFFWLNPPVTPDGSATPAELDEALRLDERLARQAQDSQAASDDYWAVWGSE